jgi:hypothetical protein
MQRFEETMQKAWKKPGFRRQTLTEKGAVLRDDAEGLAQQFSHMQQLRDAVGAATTKIAKALDKELDPLRKETDTLFAAAPGVKAKPKPAKR